ncbi:MAG: hypothetical protein F6K55_07365 [Moorea sp. SIO4A3]|nr:hypothetical protein [Moorena sp. SIO4A3]
MKVLLEVSIQQSAVNCQQSVVIILFKSFSHRVCVAVKLIANCLYTVYHSYEVHIIFSFFPAPCSLLPAPCSLHQSINLA